MKNSNLGRPALRDDERGIALAIAIMAIVLLGALVTGTFFAARMEIGSGRNSVYTVQATEAAEAGLTDAMVNWNSTWNGYSLGVQASETTQYPFSSVGNSSVRFTNTVTRMAGGVYMISSQGQKLDLSGNILATRYLAKLAKLVTATMDIQAAVTANAHVQVSGNTTKIDGFDALPPGWGGECPAPTAGSGVTGIRTSSDVGESGNPDIYGTPQPTRPNDGTVTSALFTGPFATLSAAATKILTSAGGTQVYSPDPTTTGSPTRCNTSDINNWGEPYRITGHIPQCITYFPVVYYPGPGTLKLTNGRAQGIIVSAANIDIAGNFEFDGIILALGSVDTHGTGNKVSGAVLSGNANISDDDAIAGTPTITYSSCAIQKALTNSAKGVALRERNWAQVSPM